MWEVVKAYVSPKRTAEDIAKTADDHLPSLTVTEKHLERWHNIAFDIYLSLITEPGGAPNSFVCVPQIIATLEIFAQAASVNCRKYIRDLIFPENSSSLLCSGSLANYLAEWESSVHDASHPGNFFTQRRFIVHPNFTKSYGYETFTTLKSMATEVKIYNDIHFKENMTSWLRNSCKMTTISDRIMPVETWPMNRNNQQTINNQKCPIFIAGSHFEFSIKSNVLECEKIYKIKFYGRRSTSVFACKLQCSTLCPFKSLKISDKSSMIPLPSSCENVSLFIIDNCDAIDIKDGSQLTSHVMSMDKAQINKKIKTMYLPMFFDFPTKTTNIAHALSCSTNHMDKLFQPDSFGDLGYDANEPSATTTSKAVSNIQHYDYIEMLRRPGSAEPLQGESMSEHVYVVSQPFMFIVWDNVRKISIYIARIGQPDSAEGGGAVPDEESKDDGSESKPPNKNVMDFLKLRKKSPKKVIVDTIETPANTQRAEIN